jgi:hypothetical protein
LFDHSLNGGQLTCDPMESVRQFCLFFVVQHRSEAKCRAVRVTLIIAWDFRKPQRDQPRGTRVIFGGFNRM